jgi:hypothetical protein
MKDTMIKLNFTYSYRYKTYTLDQKEDHWPEIYHLCRKFVSKILKKLPTNIILYIDQIPFKNGIPIYIKKSYDFHRINYSLVNKYRPRGVLYPRLREVLLKHFNCSNGCYTFYFNIEENKGDN